LIATLRAAEIERSGGQKGRGLGGRNFCPPSLSDSDFSVAEFRANEVGAPLKNIIDDNNSMIQNFEPNLDQ
jgi:hypothetical protein